MALSCSLQLPFLVVFASGISFQVLTWQEAHYWRATTRLSAALLLLCTHFSGSAAFLLVLSRYARVAPRVEAAQQ